MLSGKQRSEASYVLTAVYLISKKHRDKLCNPGQKKIGVQGLSIACLSARDKKTVLEMADCSLCYRAYLIGGIPLIRTADCAREGSEILFRIDVEHAAARRIGAGIFIGSAAFGLSVFRYPFHLGADELHGRPFAAQVGFASLPLHRELGVLRTAGAAQFINGTVRIF